MKNLKGSPGKEVEAVWACDAKEGDGNGSTREKEAREVFIRT